MWKVVDAKLTFQSLQNNDQSVRLENCHHEVLELNEQSESFCRYVAGSEHWDAL